MSRSVGIKRDLRLSRLETYSNYYYLNFRSFIGQHGDCYDRFLIRMNEMSESLNIINQVIYKIIKFKKVSNKQNLGGADIKKNFESSVTLFPHNIIKYLYPNYLNYKNIKNNYSSMEDLIKHFKY